MPRPISVYRLAELSPDQYQRLLSRTEDDLSGYMTQVQPLILTVSGWSFRSLAAGHARGTRP